MLHIIQNKQELHQWLRKNDKSAIAIKAGYSATSSIDTAGNIYKYFQVI